MAENFILGVDVGGTKVAAGLVNHQGQIVARVRRPMIAQRSADEGLAAVMRAIEAAQAAAAARDITPTAVGISAPGYVDPHLGVVIRATNLPCWRDFPLGLRIADALGLPVALDNDGNAAALAEAQWGAGVGFGSVFYVTLGTGIGTGFVIQRRIWHGRTGAAAEGGHMPIDYRGPRCLCGKRGCIEMFAAGPAIAARARARLKRRHKTKSKLLELAGGRADRLTPEIIGKASLEGDPLATEVLEETADYLAIWLGSIIDLLEPEVIVMGGGLGHLMSNFLGHIRSRLEVWSINLRSGEIPIVSANYGAQSGIAGAAALCLQAAPP